MRIRERDAEFKDFYIREAPRLRRLALMLTGDQQRAADITHDTLLKLYTSWKRVKNEDPGPYARRVLVNLCRNAHRRRMLELRKMPPVIEDVVDRDGHVEEALRVATALSALTPIKRAVVVLRFYEDMTETQIAQVLDRPLNTIKSDLRRALDRMRPMLEENARESR